MSTTDQIISGDLDLYEFLEVQPNCDDTIIRKQYRKKALEYHPDKNSDSKDKFQILSQVYEILSNETLREQYDEIRQRKLNQKHIDSQLDEQTKRFKEELLKAEKKFDSKKTFSSVDAIELQKIREDGAKRLKKLESRILNSSAAYVSYKDLEVDKKIDITDNSEKTTKVILKWKLKPELEDKLTLSMISEIMTVFGPVESIEKIPSSDRYEWALLRFHNEENVDRATQHNYRESASLWDGTPYRKLASLLRDCIIFNPTTKDKNLDSRFEKYRKESGITEDIFTDNEIINDVMIQKINEEISKSYLT